MFATFNLQLMPTATLDAAPENPAGLQVPGVEPVDIEASGFARLLQFQADTGTEAAIPRGEFVPEGGKILPQAEPIPTVSEELPVLDVTSPLIADTDAEAPAALPAWTSADDLMEAPVDEIITLIPQAQSASPTDAGKAQAAVAAQAELKPQAPPAAALQRAASEAAVAEAVKPQAPVDTSQIGPGAAVAAQARELAQIDRRDLMMARNDQPTIAREVAAAPRTIISPEAEVVPRVSVTPEATIVPDRGAPTNSATPAISTLASAVNQVAGATPRDPGLVPQTSTDLVRTPVTDPAWGERIGQRVVMMAGNQLQQAEIRLTPAELGPVRVQIAVEDGATNVTFHAQHAVTREAIEAAMPRLREMLAESGLSLGQANVGGDSVAEGQRERREAANAAPNGDANAELMDDTQPERQKTVTSDGLIDTFA